MAGNGVLGGLFAARLAAGAGAFDRPPQRKAPVTVFCPSEGVREGGLGFGHAVSPFTSPSCTAPGISWSGCVLGLWAKKRVRRRAWQPRRTARYGCRRANCVAG